MARIPTFENTTKLIARALGISAEALLASFRPAHAGDLNAIVEFRQRNAEDRIRAADSDYLYWRYRLGRTEGGLGELWILHQDTELLGIIGTEDMICAHQGKRWVGVRTMDILIHKRLHSSGLGVWLNQAIFRNRDFTIAVGGNKNSSGTVKRLFHPLKPMRQFVQPVNISGYILRKLPYPALAKLVSVLANGVMHSWRTLGSLSFRHDIAIRPLTSFAEPVTAPAQVKAGNLVSVERSAGYLNYRLFNNPRTPYIAAGAYHEGELVGYIAWRIVTRADGERWVHIIDWQASGTVLRPALIALFAHVGRQTEAARCSFALLVQHECEHYSLLRRAGFWGPRATGEKIVGLHAEDTATFDALSAAAWCLTDLCDDNDGA